jgi:hypothetical protein
MDLSKKLFVPVLEDNANQENTITQLNDYNNPNPNSDNSQNNALEISNIETPKMDEPENFQTNMEEFKVIKQIYDKEVEILPSISGRSLMSYPLPSVNDSTLSEDEKYAIQFFEMLNMKEEFEKMDKDTEFENYLSKILFQCILSVLVGYIYNYFINEFTIYNQYFNEDQAHKFAFEVLANQICTDDMINDLPSNIGDVSGYPTCIYPDDYAEKAKFINQVKGFLLKPNTLKPGFKQFIGAKPDVLGDNYETMFEMVMRFSVKVVPENASFRLRILINVCSKIKALLESCEFVKNGYIQPLIQPLMDIAVPIVGAAQDVSGLSNASMLGRIKSLIVLAAAYNSYGWLFAIVAPFAVPAAINIITGSVKGMCKIALLPIKVIQYIGTGIGQKNKEKQQRQNNPLNKLILIGHTIKVLPGDQGIIKIPYYVNLNDILDLSEELQNWQFLKRSLLSSIFDGHGVFDLADIQGPSTGDRFLAPNNPIVTLTNYISDELIQLSKYSDDNDDMIQETDDEYIPKFPEIPLRILINSMKGVSNKSSQILKHPMMIQTIKMWWEYIKKVNFTVNGTILNLLTCSADFGVGDDNISEERESFISDISSDSFYSAVDDTLLIFEDVNPNTISMVVADDEVFSENGSCSLKSFSDNTVCSILSNGNNNAISILDELSNNSIRSVKHYFNYPAINSNLELPETNQIENLTISLPDNTVVKMADLLTVKNLTESLKYSQQSAEYLGLKKIWEVKKVEDLFISPLKLEEFIVTTCPITKGGRGSKGGKKRKGILMPRKAARKQNKLVNQHRTVNNPSIMQYIPEHYINHTKQAKSKRKINKKRKTKRKGAKRNGAKQGKIATKKVFRKHHLTKKRKQHGKK